MSESRSRILGDIAQALSRHAADHISPAADLTSRPETDLPNAGSEEALRRFAESLARVGGECHILRDEEAALSQLRGILGECHGQAVLVPAGPELARMGISRIVHETGCAALDAGETDLDVAANATVGITMALGCIADTGTIVLVHATLEDQLSALLPQTHIVLLRKQAVYANKAGLLTALRSGGTNLDSAVMTWVTGPSLTADIEKVLVRGAHGPRREVVLVY